MPSLNRLSASIRVTSRGGAWSWRMVATTATGSVAETIAPTMNASTERHSGSVVEDHGHDGSDHDHAGDGQERDAAERAPQLHGIEPIGCFEDEPGQQDGHREGRRHVQVAAPREGRHHQPDDDHRDRVLHAKPARHERDQRHRDQHGHQDQQRDGCLRTDHRVMLRGRDGVNGRRPLRRTAIDGGRAPAVRLRPCWPIAGARQRAGSRRLRPGRSVRSACDRATRCSRDPCGRSPRATSRCSARS